MLTSDYKTLDELIDKYGIIMILHSLAEIISEHASSRMNDEEVEE